MHSGLRVTVGAVVGLVAAGRTREETEEIAEALSYAAWRAQEVEVRLAATRGDPGTR